MALTSLLSKLRLAPAEPDIKSPATPQGHLYPPQSINDKTSALFKSDGNSRGGFVNVDLGESPSPTPDVSLTQDRFSSGIPGVTSYPPQPSTSNLTNVRLIMNRIAALLQEQSPALYDTLAEPLPDGSAELASLQNTIYPYRLPPSVIECWKMYNGQDPDASLLSGRAPPGIFWGLWWMSPEEVETEWSYWRKFEHSDAADIFQAGAKGNDTYKASPRTAAPRYDVTLTSSPAPGPASNDALSGTNSYGVQAHGDGCTVPGTRASSFPPGWVRAKYSHPGWIPLLTDRSGNYIGVDLDPPEHNDGNAQDTCAVGQVIAFGREIDDKVVIYGTNTHDGWARFLAYFLHSVESGDFAVLGDAFGKHAKTRFLPPALDPSAPDLSISSADTSMSQNWADLSDGFGQDYVDGARYGDDMCDDGPAGFGGSSSSGTHSIWHIAPSYRQWLSIDGSGGLVGIVADRSRGQWILSGFGVDAFRERSSRAASLSSLSVRSQTSKRSSRQRRRHRDDPDSEHLASEQPDSANTSIQSASRSNIDSITSPARSHASLNSKTNRRSRRPPPPPPAPLGLPTLNGIHDPGSVQDLDLVIESPLPDAGTFESQGLITK